MLGNCIVINKMIGYFAGAIFFLIFISASPCLADDYIGDSSTIVPDLFTGTYSYNLPIKVIPGRNGMDPKLALNYRSNRSLEERGWLGRGWELDLGSVERSTMGSGVSYSADKYLLRNASGAVALRKDSSDSEGKTYNAVIEKNFYRIKKEIANDGKPYWIVTDKNGVRYYYGQVVASRQDDPSDGSRIFKWCLDKIIDTNDNSIDVSYFKDQGQIYPETINYSSGQLLFEREDAGDCPYTSTDRTDFAVTTAYRLQSVVVKDKNNHVERAYTIAYDDSHLKSVLETGRGSEALQPITFEWETGSPTTFRYISKITNETGGITSIDFRNEVITVWSSNSIVYFKEMPVLGSVTLSDGNGNVSTTSYDYSGGFYFIGVIPIVVNGSTLYYPIESEFRGFNKATVTGPSGTNGEQLKTETWFHQGNDTLVGVNNQMVYVGYTKGLPYRVKVSDISGKKYYETTTRYKSDAVFGAPFYTPPLQVDTYVYDGESTAMHTKTVYTYDQTNGNLLQEDRYGNVDISSDDTTIVNTYSPNTTDWIVGLPAAVDTYQGIGTTTKVAGSEFYYDDLASCASTPTGNQTPIKGNLTRSVKWLNGGTSPQEWTAYDTYGNASCSRDANGNITSIAYDNGTSTFPVSVTNALGKTATIQYYGVDGVATDGGGYGQVKSIVDANGAITNIEYDGYGRKTKEIGPDGSWIAWNYSVYGVVGEQKVRMDSSAGEWNEELFDGMGRTYKTSRSGPDLKTVNTEVVFDARGNVRQSSLPYFTGESPQFETFDYDALGRILQVTKPDATRQLACYNAQAGITVSIDSAGNRRRETRNALNQLVKIEEYAGVYATCSTDIGTPYAATTYQYDLLGNMKRIIDAQGNSTTMLYDTLGRKYRMVDPDMGTWNYSYDATGNLVSQTDAKGQTVAFNYDPLNRVTLKDYPTGTDVTYTYDEATSFNGIGRLTSMSDASGTTQYHYDAAGRPTKNIRIIDGTSYQIEASYDGLDRIKTITYPDNETVNYTYDPGGNLSAIPGYAIFSGYNALGNPETVTFGNGVQTGYSYDPLNGRLSTSAIGKDGTSYAGVSYDYYPDGHIHTITDQLDANRSQSFVYDGVKRLVQAQSQAYGVHNYTYNKIGNLLSKDGATYTYGFMSPMGTSMSIRPHAVSSIIEDGATRTFSYDSNGNMTADGQRSMGYNVDNMPTTVTKDGLVTSFMYDGNGTRVKKITPNFTTIYLDKLYECVNGVCGKYIFANGQRLALKTSAKTYYYHPDHLGSTSLVTDESGSKVEEISYLPYGSTLLETGSAQVNHLYTGQELDAETELYNYNARMYDPDLGRFISPDSIVPDPFDPQSFNRYSYVLNNPLNFIDPSGHESITLPLYGGSFWNTWWDWWGFDSRGSSGGSPGYSFGFPGDTSWDSIIWDLFQIKMLNTIESIPGHRLAEGVGSYGYVQNNPINYLDPFGLCRKKGESRVACADRVAKEVLGEKLEHIDGFGYWGLGAWTVSTTLGNTALTSVADKAASEAIKSAGTAGARAEGNIVVKIAASNKAAKSAARIATMRGGLAMLSKVSGILGLAATGTSATMRGLGYYFGDCSEECSNCSN